MRIASNVAIISLAFVLSACTGGSPDVGLKKVAGNVTPTPDPVQRVQPVPDNLNGQPSPTPLSNSVNSIATGRRVPPPRTVPLGTPAPLEFRPGAENSRTATTMDAEGQAVEIRIFKDHPQLVRVEATWLGPKDKLLRITLRNGSTVEVRTDQIAALATATSRQLVALAGAAK